MLHVGHVEGVLRDIVRLREAGLHTALAQLVVVGDIGARLREEDRGVFVVSQVRMHQGASGAMPATASTTAGSSSYSTFTSRAASSAMSWVSAEMATTASPR